MNLFQRWCLPALGIARRLEPWAQSLALLAGRLYLLMFSSPRV